MTDMNGTIIKGLRSKGQFIKEIKKFEMDCHEMNNITPDTVGTAKTIKIMGYDIVIDYRVKMSPEDLLECGFEIVY